MANVNYNHLRYFWSVAHEGNLTRAAERLNISQSSVSVQIQKLEDELDVQLFDRRGKRLVLTEAGQIALDHADAIFATGDELVATLRYRGRSRQSIRIGALATLSRNFQMRFLAPLLGRSDVELILRSGTLGGLLKRLAAHQLDAVLATSVPPRDEKNSLIAHPIADQPVSLVSSPHRLNGDGQRELADILATEPLVLPSADSSIRSGFDALVDAFGIRPRVAAEVDDMALMRLLARENVGMAVVPPIVVRDELESGQLVEVEQLPGLKETFFAITLTRRFPNPLLRALIVERTREE